MEKDYKKLLEEWSPFLKWSPEKEQLMNKSILYVDEWLMKPDPEILAATKRAFDALVAYERYCSSYESMKELNKYSKEVTSDDTRPAAQAMLHAIGLTSEDLKKELSLQMVKLDLMFMVEKLQYL